MSSPSVLVTISIRSATPKWSGVPRPLSPEYTGRVTVVHDHRCIIPIRQLDDPIEFREIAIHGEDPVRRDQAKAIGCRVAQLGFQVCHIGVRVAEPGGLAEPDAVNQAGVVQARR